jgi:hypothetical protein
MACTEFKLLITRMSMIRSVNFLIGDKFFGLVTGNSLDVWRTVVRMPPTLPLSFSDRKEGIFGVYGGKQS